MSGTLFTTLMTHVSNAAPIIAVAASLLAITALIYATILERRISRLTLGRSGSLDESIAIISRELKDMHEFKGEVEKYLKLVETRLRGSVGSVGLVRFNPFSDGQGGNQSFAAAIVDEEGRGVVLSTLYARNHVGVYAKPLAAWVSTYELSNEEKAAIEEARKNIADRRKF
jgi:hypothetical protein